MHVIGAWGHARGTGSRDKLAIGATGHVRNTGKSNRAAIGVSGYAGLGAWRRVANRVRWGRVARELVLVAIFLAVYEEIRWHMVQAGGAAASHALSVVSAERALGLFHERAVQAVFTPWDSVTDAFNTYYGGTHFLVPAAILAWLLLRHPERYARARTTLAVMTAVAFVCFWLYPVAPPRLLPASFGFVDTLRDGASGHLEGSLINTAGDQYASMPSLHVAWAVWCALALYPMFRHWALRALVVAYPVMTTVVVVATGNHYLLDAVAGTLLAHSRRAQARFRRTGRRRRSGTRGRGRRERCVRPWPGAGSKGWPVI